MITTRVLKDQDVEPVLELLRASLGEPPLLRRTPELFAWKHFDNPFGRSIAVLAEAGGRIVGLRALMRWELTTPAGGALRCVRAVDTATHPDFQRRGIFRRLTEEALEIAVANGVDLVFNTPNEKSGAGYLSMGWKTVGPIGVMARPLLRAMASDRSEPRLAGAPPAWPLSVTDRRPLGLRTPRTEPYLRWRFDAHPTARYFKVESGGATAVARPNRRGGRREMVLADVFGPRSASAIRRAARASHAAYMVGWFSPGTPERRAAIGAGLVPVPGVTALTLLARPLRDLDVDVTAMSSWHLALSDLELL